MANLTDTEREEINNAWLAFQAAAEELQLKIRHALGPNSFEYQRAKAYWIGRLEEMQEQKNLYYCTIPETLQQLQVIDSDGEFIADLDPDDSYEDEFADYSIGLV